MSKVKIVLNRDGVRSLLRSAEMQAICEQHASNARSKLGDGYEVSTFVGKNRCNASVKAVSKKARKENMKDNTILKAIGSGK